MLTASCLVGSDRLAIYSNPRTTSMPTDWRSSFKALGLHYEWDSIVNLGMKRPVTAMYLVFLAVAFRELLFLRRVR